MSVQSATGRREPPAFRRVRVHSTARLGPRMVRITFAGDELSGLEIEDPAASVRLLLPNPGEDLTIPTWNGNEFLRDDGSRPIIRTFTPRRFDPEVPELDLDLVLHSAGAASAWALQATEGAQAAISGPGRGYEVDPGVTDYLLVGDESAIPAISQLLEAIAPNATIRVHLEVEGEFGQVDLPGHPGRHLSWHTLDDEQRGSHVVRALASEEIGPDTTIWCAGQAAAMQKVRNHLFKERGVARSQATVRGYWK
ncbi:MAG: siderophore-interacting protein [Acidimicrobiia bacterium]|nr:siderophore-interacting protein [Acidimicrobiia bacterium]